MIRLRQLATRKSRPAKHLRGLPELLRRLAQPRRTSAARTDRAHDDAGFCTTRALAQADELDDAALRQLAADVVDAVTEKRATWTRWNLLAEAARASKTLRLDSASDRLRLVERIAQRAIDDHCLQLTPPDLTPLVTEFARADGTSAFRRHRAEVFTSSRVLDAEERLLAAATTTTAPRIDADAVARMLQETVAFGLSADQRAAVHAIAASGRDLDVLVGPAGSGKTRTLRALRAAWEVAFGPGSVDRARAVRDRRA